MSTKTAAALAAVQDRLPEILERHQIPGISIGVLASGEIHTAAAGVLSRATQVGVTTDSVFQIGSITKVWTATLIMQLVDDGLLDLDRPVRDVLPEFVIGDAAAQEHITTRHLLDHTAGFEGDVFLDLGSGPDCVEKYMGVIAEQAQLFEVGEMFSYNNAAFVVLGRIVEVLRGMPFNAALRKHLIEPMGLTHAATCADEAIMFRAAVGHVADGAGGYVPAHVWSLPHSSAPAGAMYAASSTDLLRFAQMHLAGGVTPDGVRVLSEESVRAMQVPQVPLPELGALMGSFWGLGWALYDWEGGRAIGHDGGTIGQSSFLRIIPEAGVAVAVFTNGGAVANVMPEIIAPLLAELAGVSVPDLPAPTATKQAVDAGRISGTYTSGVVDSTVSVDEDDRVWLTQQFKGIYAEVGREVDATELTPWRNDTYVAVLPEAGMHLAYAFVGDDGDGHAQFLHYARADRRVRAEDER